MLTKSELTAYFRTNDKTSEVIGGRQAGVFQAFSALAGYEQQGVPSKPRSVASNGNAKVAKAKSPKPQQQAASTNEAVKISAPHNSSSKRDMALTVRIEINLPAEGSQETYDNIFKSIKANLIDV